MQFLFLFTPFLCVAWDLSRLDSFCLDIYMCWSSMRYIGLWFIVSYFEFADDSLPSIYHFKCNIFLIVQLSTHLHLYIIIWPLHSSYTNLSLFSPQPTSDEYIELEILFLVNGWRMLAFRSDWFEFRHTLMRTI